jgi:hypothetical protein
MKTCVRFLILLGFGVSLSFVGMGAELPVTRVVLYKHGVGFFERSGNVAAGESVQLQFKQSEMNDVLKSLTIDSRGGVVAGVRYDSSEPLEKKLEAFPFRVGEAQPLSRILDQFKGARLRLRLAGGDIEGTIISSRTIAATEQQAERDELVLLMDNAEIRNVDPLAASGVQFVDTKIQQQFRDYLQFVANARNLDKRNLTIDASGQNAGQVSARYIIPAPVWKSSYRLVFDSQAQPMLEGWSIVDNTTGEDWTPRSRMSRPPSSSPAALYFWYSSSRRTSSARGSTPASSTPAGSSATSVRGRSSFDFMRTSCAAIARNSPATSMSSSRSASSVAR